MSELSFRKTLRVLRRMNGLTQTEVAKRLNITRSAYSYYETGKSRPDYEALIRLAELFEVSVDFLLGVEKIPVSRQNAFLQSFFRLEEKERSVFLRRLEKLSQKEKK